MTIALLLAVSLPAAARIVDPFSFGKPAFCSPKKPLRDFGISRLPSVPELPPDGQLPFARPNVNVYGATFGRILTERGSFGLGFSEENYEGTVRLDWTVTAQMWTVDRRGTPLREVDSSSLSIGRLDALNQPHLTLETLGRRGFYRFDVQFADRDGETLGSYSTYLKVVRPYWKARLGLDRRTYRPGQLVISRPENLGTDWMSFGEDFAVQRWEAGEWIGVPGLSPEAWLLWLGYAGPGSPGRCSALSLPRDVAPGRYRIVKHVGEGLDPRGSRSHWLAAPFSVR